MATLEEIRRSWTLSDLLDANELLLMKEDAEKKEADKIKDLKGA